LDGDRPIAVSPRHSVRLAREYLDLIERAPDHDYVVRTIAKREVNGLPLMTAEIVIAGEHTRRLHPLSATYPLHFRKTYFAARWQADPEREFQNHLAASRVLPIAPPIGFGPRELRSCLVPGRPYNRLSPFGAEPPESNVRIAQSLELAKAAGLWRLAQEALTALTRLHEHGLTHGDAELHNFIVCPAPLELVLIDFEASVSQLTLDEATFSARCAADLAPLLREAIYLQCALGRQPDALGNRAFAALDQLFKRPDRFAKAIDENAEFEQ
jgi:hypothetical protein